MGWYTSLALDSGGSPHISYFDGTNDSLKYAWMSGTTWLSETVDAMGYKPAYSSRTSLELDQADSPHICYYDAINDDLKLAYFDGATWISQTVDSSGDVGAYCSLALDPVGCPHISYYDATKGDLKYAYVSSPRLIVVKQAAPDPVAAGSALTYTLRLTNTGNVNLSAALTDALPDHVTPTGELTWMPPPILPEDTWTETVVVTVDVGYVGLLTNVLQVSTVEGATGVYTRTVQVEESVQGLSAGNDGPTVLGDTTTLTATVTAGSHVTYTWAFGDGGTGSGAVVPHTYSNTGVYTAVVTASNRVSELTATTSVTITPPSFYIYLPVILRGS